MSAQKRYDEALADLRRAQVACAEAAADLVEKQPTWLLKSLKRASCEVDMWPEWKRKLAREWR